MNTNTFNTMRESDPQSRFVGRQEGGAGSRKQPALSNPKGECHPLPSSHQHIVNTMKSYLARVSRKAPPWLSTTTWFSLTSEQIQTSFKKTLGF